jgi:putative FmdB family regulatory protein
MPLYEYSCCKCGHKFEMYRFFYQNDEHVECPECGEKEAEKCFSTFSSSSTSSCSTTSSNYG